MNSEQQPNETPDYQNSSEAQPLPATPSQEVPSTNPEPVIETQPVMATSQPMTPELQAAEPTSKFPLASLIVSGVAFLTVAPAPVAVSFATASLIGSRNKKEKLFSIIALSISILPFIVFLIFSFMTLRGVLVGDSDRLVDATNPLIIGSYIIITGGAIPLLYGIVALIASRKKLYTKRWLALIVAGAVFTLLGVSQYVWSASDSAKASWTQAHKTAVSGDTTDVATARELDYYDSKKDFAKGESAVFGPAIIKDVIVKVAKDEKGDDLLSYSNDGYKSVLIAFNVEFAEGTPSDVKEKFDMLYQEDLRVIASGTRYANLLADSSRSGQKIKSSLDRTYFIEVSIKNSQQPDKLEYKMETPTLYILGEDAPDSLTWTLKL